VAEVAFDWGNPASADLQDPGEDYTLAVQFQLSASYNITGVRWRIPGTAPTGTCKAVLYSGAGSLLASKDFTVISAEEGTDKDVDFDAPVLGAASTNYRAGIYTPNRYCATANYTWPQTDGVLTATAANGFLTTEDAFPGTESGNDANYHVSPLVDDTPLNRPRRRRVTTYVRGLDGRLNDIMTILGTTTPSLWPFWESTGTLVTGISVGDLIPSETAAAAEALEDDFAPVMLPCGLFSYHFHPTGDHHLAGIDSNSYSFGNGTVDTPFSVGAWIRPNAIVTNVIMGKYDSAGNLEEWRFFIDSAGKLSLELHDASASATEIAASTSALTIGQWINVVATYDGGETDPVVNLYVNGVLANDGTTTESGTYTAMENTAAPLTVGCSGVTATPVAEFHGRIALPFLTGKALSAAEVAQLYALTQSMVGIS
jgi:hypothetical protein